MIAANPTWKRKTSTRFLCCVPVLIIFLSKMVSAEPVNIQIRNLDGIGIEGVAIYMQSQGRDDPPGSNKVAVNILQKDKGFSPYLTVAQYGTRVTFSNSDDITHHIYSVTGIERFSFFIRAGEISPEMTIRQSGLIAMGCNIHDWMSGYLLVVGTPYYTLTDSRGQASIEVNEAGRYQIIAWHPQFKEEIVKTIKIPSADTVVLKIQQKMAPIPRQEGVDNFDFLENY